MTMERKRYRAFISYSQRDTIAAQRLHRALENYRVPLGVSPDVVPSKRRLLGKFFRDTDDMSAASDISATVRGAIEDSESLIVVCSPRSAQSRWVDTEIQHFRKTGRGDRIFAVIIEGEPNSHDPNTECFPPSLRLDAGPDLHPDDMPVEPVGIDMRVDQLERVCARIAAGLLNVPFDQLWQRRRREAIRQWWIRGGVAAGTVLLAGALMLSLQSNAARANGQTMANAFADLAKDANAEFRHDRAARYAMAGLNGATDPLLGFDAAPAQAELLRAENGGRAFARLSGHRGNVNGVVFNHKGDQILSVSDDDTVRVWDWRAGRQLRLFDGHEGPITAAEFTPDDARVITTGTDRTARIWDIATGKLGPVLAGHRDEVLALAVSADGARIATGDVTGETLLWAADGRLIQRIGGPRGVVIRLAFSPNSDRLLIIDSAQTARIVASRDGRLLHTLRMRESDLAGGAWSADSAQVAVTSTTGRTTLFSSASGQARRTLTDSQGATFGVFLNPDGSKVFSLAEDGAVVVWDAATGAIVATPQATDSLFNALLSRDGQMLATGGGRGEVALWAAPYFLEAGKLNGHEGAVAGLAFSPDGAWLATASSDRTIRIWRVANPALLLQAAPHRDGISALALNGAGTRALVAAADRTASLVDLASGQTLRRFVGHRREIVSAVFNADESRVLTAAGDGTARLWDAASGAELLTLDIGHRSVTRAAFSPDGAQIITASGSGLARLWDARSGALRKTLQANDAFLADAAFSPSGARVATAGFDGVTRIWDVASGRQLQALIGPKSSALRVLFSPDGGRLLTMYGSAEAILWDGASGAQISVLAGHQQYIRTIAFSPDGAWIATGANDFDARLWDGRTGRFARALRGHLLPIAEVAFSADSTRIVTASDGGSARVWDVATGREVAQFRAAGFVPVNHAAFTPDGARLVLGLGDGRVQVWDAAPTRQAPAIVRAQACGQSLANGLSQFTDAEWDRAKAIDPSVPRDVCQPHAPWARLFARPAKPAQ
jgi:WD40 repeat protein